MTNALTALLGAFPHAMVVVDAHGTLTAATPKASELFDVFDGELVGQSWAVVVEAVGLPRRLLGPVQLDGSRVQVRGRIDVDVDSSEGQDGTWVYVFRRPGRRARDQERLHALLMSSAEGSNHGIELTDSDGRFVWVNKSWERLTGYPVAEAVGRTPAELLRSGAHSTAFLREIEDALARGERWQGNVVSRRRDGIDSEMELELWPKRSPQAPFWASWASAGTCKRSGRGSFWSDSCSTWSGWRASGSSQQA